MSELQLTPLHRERIELWCEALESGKYQQERQMLCSGDKFCCLGVACDISGVGDWDLGYDYITGNHSDGATLPLAVRDWLGLAECDPYVDIEDGSYACVTDLNDGRLYTFPQIAAAIRRTYLEVKPCV